MGSKKVSDREILDAIEILNENQDRANRLRGMNNFNPGHRRWRIQKEVYYLTGQKYSASGFRNRLKKLYKKGVLTKDRLGNSLVFYQIKKDHRRLAGVL